MAGFKKAAGKSAPAEKPAAKAKTEYTPKENEFGIFKNIKSKKGNEFQAIEVLQDMTLSKGQLIVFQSLDEELNWLAENNHITAEEAASRSKNMSAWNLGKFRVLPPQG